MAQTILFSKQNFINWVAKQIKDDECVIMTDALQETIVNKKRYKSSFVYSSDIFPTQDVRNIMHNKNIAVCIPKINQLSITDQDEIKTQPLI